MDSTLSSVLILSVMFTTVMLSAHLIISSNQRAATSMISASDIATHRAKTNVRLPNTITSTGKRLTIKVSNIGNTQLYDYEHMDLIVEYKSNDTGEILYTRIPYLNEQASANPNHLYSNVWIDKHRSPDFYQSEIWDKNEILSIRAILDPRQEANSPAKVIMSTENGVTVTGEFYRPYWMDLPETPENVSYGGSLATDGTYIYSLLGNNSSKFWKYVINDEKDIIDNKWVQLASIPVSIEEGGALVHAGTYVYALQGDNKSTFWRYNIALNTWAEMQPTPSTVRFGGGLTWDGSDTIYAFRGSIDSSSEVCCNNFWAYDITTNEWSTTNAATPENIHSGASLVYISGDIYAVRGDNTSDFWKYNITNDSWTNLPSLPQPIDEGGNLVWTGNNHIFAWRGDSTADFWRYSISEGNWEILNDVPEPLAGGANFIYLDGEIYGFPGNKKNDFWSYQPRGY